MDKIKEIFQSIWLKIVSALKNFENSSAFEHLMRRYESMSPSGQKTFMGILKLSALTTIAFMILGGPFMLLTKLNSIQKLEQLENEAIVFKADYEAQTKGFEAPIGWRNMPASSASELANIFNEYLPSIGVPEEFGTLVATGETLTLTLREISIRQATNILFQLEGFYPKLKNQTLKIRPNAGQRDILDMDATFKFNPAFANQFSRADSGMNDEHSEENFSPENMPPPPSNNRRNSPNIPDFGNDGGDIQNEYIPPPLHPLGLNMTN